MVVYMKVDIKRDILVNNYNLVKDNCFVLRL